MTTEQEVSMDLKSMEDLRRFVEEQAGAEKAEQVVNKMQQIMDHIKELPPEEKKKYLEQFGERMKQMQKTLQEKLAGKVQLAITINFIVQIVFYALIVIFFIIITVFIGRKLYRILTEREKRKLDKKKQKKEKSGKKKKN